MKTEKRLGMSKPNLNRVSGILLHPISLPSPYGIGDMGYEAYRFIDFLKRAGQHLWQTLPLTPTGFGDSPYQSFSAFAGQPLLISPDLLMEMGLVWHDDLEEYPHKEERYVDYGAVLTWKTKMFQKAFERFYQLGEEVHKEYQEFILENKFWLEDYALFMSCKEKHEGQSWIFWDEEYRTPTEEVKEAMKLEFADSMNFYYFVQFIFFKQWAQLRAYANENGIQIIGDIPLFMSLDSADVWANQGLFQLDSQGYPTAVAGVPPDYFSETGQLWGNPLYDWEAHKADGFTWWIARIRNQLKISDILRIDHFRGLDEYWSIPAGEETALNGSWKPGPKEAFFLAIQEKLGNDLPFIAEDLGIITDSVCQLRDKFDLPGMKILQFAFDSEEQSAFLPHNFTTTNCICYTGTHDNDTTVGWYQTASRHSQDKVRRYMNSDGSYIHWDFVRMCLGSIAAYAIIPFQDLIAAGKEARMNTPGGGARNWAWRCTKEEINDWLADMLYNVCELYGRI